MLPQHNNQTPRFNNNNNANNTQKGQKVAVQSHDTIFSALKVTLIHNRTRKTRPHARTKAIKLLQSCLGQAQNNNLITQPTYRGIPIKTILIDFILMAKHISNLKTIKKKESTISLA